MEGMGEETLSFPLLKSGKRQKVHLGRSVSTHLSPIVDMTKPRYSEHILPVPWPFVISRFHCTYNSWVQTVHSKKKISSRKSWNSKQQDIQIRSRSNIKIFRRTVFNSSTCLTLYLAKADTAMLFSSLSCLICSFKYLEK